MTFYRLRRALGLVRRVGPAEPLTPLIGDKLRQALTDLETDTDLKMPTTRAGWLGIAGGLCFTVAVATLAFTTLAPPLRIFVAGASAYAGLWSRHIDRRRLPHGCETLGDLARLVTEQNRGRLACGFEEDQCDNPASRALLVCVRLNKIECAAVPQCATLSCSSYELNPLAQVLGGAVVRGHLADEVDVAECSGSREPAGS